MKWSLNLGKIFGINVLVHFTFVLIFVYVGYYNYQEFHSISQLAYICLVVFLSFICVLMHEFGHALAARKVGIKTRQILILPIGGMAQIENMPENPKDELFVTICGPLVNLGIIIIFLPFALINHSLQEVFFINQFGDIIPDIIHVNIILFVFNLIPAYPMDGGRILRALLAFKLKYIQATLIASRVGQALAISLFAYLIWLCIDGTSDFFSVIKLLILCSFIVGLAEMEYRMVKRKHQMGGYGISGSTNINNKGLLNTSDSIGQAVHELVAKKSKILPVMFYDKVAGQVTSEMPKELTDLENGHSRTYRIYPGDSLGHALKMMEILGIPILPIYSIDEKQDINNKKEFYLLKGSV